MCMYPVTKKTNKIEDPTLVSLINIPARLFILIRKFTNILFIREKTFLLMNPNERTGFGQIQRVWYLCLLAFLALVRLLG